MFNIIDVITFSIVTITLVNICNSVRVCESFLDYYNVFPNKRCTEDSSNNLNQIEILKSWGLNAESYTVETEDYYILTITRAYGNITKENPVVIGPGFLNNGLTFLSQEYKSLPYLLAKEGYDVWLANWRGSKESRAHKYLSDSNKKYWQFSFDEMGKYDLPAILNHARQVSKKEKYIYVGYSMGCNVGYIFSLERPTLAKERLVKMISIAPAAYIPKFKGLLLILVPLIPILKQIKPLINDHDEVFPFFAKGIFGKICNLFPFNLLVCELIKGSIYGLNYPQINPKRIPIYNYFDHDSSSIRTAEHLGQLNTRKKFAAYDFGTKKNIEKYGTNSPKEYNITDVEIPVTVFAGQNDYLVRPKSAKTLYNQLQPRYRNGYFLVRDKNWSHFSVIEAKNVDTLLYESVIKAVQKKSL